MGHDYFGDVSFAEEKLQMYTKQFELTSSFSVGDNNIYQYFTSYQGSISFYCSSLGGVITSQNIFNAK